MTDENAQPAAAAPSAAPPQRQQVSDVQAREAFAATLEVLGGADSSRILKMTEQLSLAKALLRDLVTGRLAIGNAKG